MSEGFERYLTPTDADYQSVMTGGMVVLDTSALLNLYRYAAPVRTDLLEVLRHLGAQLWEPHQVMLEFWRRRESAINDYAKAATQFDKSATTAKHTATEAIRALGNQIGLSENEKSSLTEPIEKAFAELSTQVGLAMSAGGAAQTSRDTGNDPVVLALDPILCGRVGEPFTRARHSDALAEGRKRIEAKRPPGFRDGGKSGGQAEGDYLLWAQILQEAVTRDCDVLLVTADAKDDWWRSLGTAANAGPHHELLDEFYNVVGRRLFMLKPADLLAKASALLQVRIAPESLDQARRVDQFPCSPSASSGSPSASMRFAPTTACGAGNLTHCPMANTSRAPSSYAPPVPRSSSVARTCWCASARSTPRPAPPPASWCLRTDCRPGSRRRRRLCACSCAARRPGCSKPVPGSWARCGRSGKRS